MNTDNDQRRNKTRGSYDNVLRCLHPTQTRHRYHKINHQQSHSDHLLILALLSDARKHDCCNALRNEFGSEQKFGPSKLAQSANRPEQIHEKSAYSSMHSIKSTQRECLMKNDLDNQAECKQNLHADE